MPDKFPMDLQRELAAIAASVIKTSAATETSLLSAAAQTDSSPNQMLAMAIAVILMKRLATEPAFAEVGMREDVVHQVGCFALRVLEKNDNTGDDVRQLIKDRGVQWNDFLGADIAFLVGQWFRGEPDPDSDTDA